MGLQTHFKGRDITRYWHRDVPIRVAFYRFAKDQSYLFSSRGKEQVLVLLEGQLEIEGNVSGRLKRRDVFRDTPSAVYVGPGQKIRVLTRGSGEFIVIGCRAAGQGMAEIISDVVKERRGKKGYSRTVYNILPEQFPAKHLVVGETINDPGNWSSFPPHKHDINSSEEARMQEVYFFKIRPAEGFGYQRVYDHNGLDQTLTILDRDLVWIPRCYHPVTAMPGHRLYYCWALVGDGRQLKPKTEDKYEWLL